MTQCRDSERRFGAISRGLHWAVALLLLWQFAGMLCKVLIGPSAITGFLVGTHKPLGALLLALIALRALWALGQLKHRPSQPDTLLGWCARLGHLCLYALMLLVPALALLRQYGSGQAFAPFGIPLFAGGFEPIGWMTAPANALHGWLGWVLLALVAGHVLMVVVHRRLLGDDVLPRMVGRGD
ncbi:cytochrome b [Halotalea alkalilenta]|uniref:Cytochrome B n=1 Tax=Halotalea alkalilenta TaxID=376489 RepID=A0A172YDS1_9GAMM|nr:cytochrome b [Halotalea alkalilenta]ANF57421.1 cytochrome B [Halotalea alkalilenta]